MYRTFIILFLLILALGACKKLGFDPDPNKNSRANYVQDTLYAVGDSIINRGYATYTGLSDKVVLGQRDGFSAGFLIYFTFIDTLSKIDSMSLQFTTLNSYGAEMYDKISTNIYSVDSAWNIDANSYNRFRNPPITNMEFVTKGSFSTQDSSTSTFNIPLNFNNIWNADIDQLTDSLVYNFYFSLGDGNENAMVELASTVASSQYPLLIYRKNLNDTTITDTVAAIVSASIFNYDYKNGTALNHSDETLLISSGILNHSLIKFDFSGLPKTVLFFRANLELTEDDMNEYANSSNQSDFSFRALENLADSTYNPTDVFSMTSEDGITKTTSTSAQTFATRFIQPFTNGDFGNQWLEISFPVSNEADNISVMRYWGVNASKSLRPRLIISYLNPLN